MSNLNSRIKLFSLDVSGEWEDQGIGLASITQTTI